MTRTKSLPPDLPPLPEHWEWKSLQELLQAQRNICYGVVQPGDHMVGGIPIVRAKGIKNGRVEEPDPLRIAPEIDAKHTKSRLIGGEILITLVGEYFGQVAVAPPTLAGFNTARAVGVVPVESDAQFISFALQAPATQHYIKTWATTTAQPTLNLCDVAQLPIPMPPKWERDKIAHILGTLDDKVELNQQMNHTLENIARALFKSWFIDFDPVRAKMDGQQPAGIDAETAALFPDEFEESAIGQIPKGWEILPLSVVCERITDGSHTSPKSVDIGYPMASVKDMHDWGININSCRRISEEDYEKLLRNDCKPKLGDVLIAKDGSYLKHIFVVGKEQNLVILSSIAILRPNQRINSHILAFTLQGETVLARMHNYVSGAVLQRIVLKDFRNFSILVPPQDLQTIWFERVGMNIYLCWQNIEEASTLTSLRDALLPKLLSGEIRVKDAEGIVETVA